MVVVQKKKKKWGKLGNTDHLVETRRWEIDYVQFNTSNNSRCSWHRETINYQKKHFSNVETPKFPSPPPPQRELHLGALGCDANISKCLNGVISKSKSDYTWEHSLNVSRGLSPSENDPNSVTNIASNIYYFTVPYQDKCRCKRRIYPTRRGQ